MALPTRHILLTSGRRWTFRALVGVLAGIALAVLLAGPITVLSDNWSVIGITVIAAEIIVLFSGLAWLGMLSVSKRR